MRLVANIIRGGGVAVIPTDTLYGIAANPLLTNVVKKVYRIKERPLNKPIPVLVSSIAKSKELVCWNRLAEKLAEKYWPGPLTIVLPAKEKVPGILRSEAGKLGVRMPDHDVALAIIEESGGYVTGTSANISALPPARRVEELDPRIIERVDIVVDSGPTLGKPSTVVEVVDRGRVIKVREGAIPFNEILKLISKGCVP